MKNFLLLQAHEKQRRAEALLRQQRFKEAAECHETVACLLKEAHAQLSASFVNVVPLEGYSRESGSNNSSIHSIAALESLVLQQDFHTRQAAVVR